MASKRLNELLRQENNKINEEGARWLQQYAAKAGRSKSFFRTTFFFICKDLAEHPEKAWRNSREQQDSIKRFLKDRNIAPTKNGWNPVPWFTAEWQKWSNGDKTDFDEEHDRFIERRENKAMGIKEIKFKDDEFARVAAGFFATGNKFPQTAEVQDLMPPTTPWQELARQLLWEPLEKMDDVARLLEDKPQLILYGPPGTGKTYVAREIARYLADNEEPIFVQFHASYAYEDFVQGYRPGFSNNGDSVFDLVDGHLLKAQEKAKLSPDRKVVLLIDEINRANLPRVFGELFFALEYRDKEVHLQYRQEPLRLAENLVVLGTMNTADRGIAQIDAALRRRFHFFPLYPDKDPIKDLLRRYLRAEHNDSSLADWLPDMVDQANQKLTDHGFRDALIGHSHFMSPILDEDRVELIWNYSIMPMLEERYPGDERRVAEFAFNALRRDAGSGSE